MCVGLGQEHPEYKSSFIARCLGLSRRIKCYYNKNKIIDKYIEVKEKILIIAKENNFNYGKRRICQELRNKFNIFLDVQVVSRLMHELDIVVKCRKRSKYKSYMGELCTLSPNLLNRDFSTTGPFQKIVTDISEFAVENEKLYFSPFVDLFSNRIISYTLCRHPTVQSVVAGLQATLNLIPDNSNTIIHSDQGHHYQHINYRDMIKNSGKAIQSMSRKGNCLDNGACESVFGRVKNEVFDNISYKSIDELTNSLDKYIEYYNNERIQLRINGTSPTQYLLDWLVNQQSQQV